MISLVMSDQFLCWGTKFYHRGTAPPSLETGSWVLPEVCEILGLYLKLIPCQAASAAVMERLEPYSNLQLNMHWFSVGKSSMNFFLSRYV